MGRASSAGRDEAASSARAPRAKMRGMAVVLRRKFSIVNPRTKEKLSAQGELGQPDGCPAALGGLVGTDSDTVPISGLDGVRPGVAILEQGRSYRKRQRWATMSESLIRMWQVSTANRFPDFFWISCAACSW